MIHSSSQITIKYNNKIQYQENHKNILDLDNYICSLYLVLVYKISIYSSIVVIFILLTVQQCQITISYHI